MTDKLKGIDTDKKYVEIGSVAYVRTYLVALRDISSFTVQFTWRHCYHGRCDVVTPTPQ